VRRRIEAASEEWQRLGRSPDLLWRDRRLPEADRITQGSLTEHARAFLAASRKTVQRARRRRLAIAIGIPVAIVALVALVRLRIQAAADERIARKTVSATSAWRCTSSRRRRCSPVQATRSRRCAPATRRVRAVRRPRAPGGRSGMVRGAPTGRELDATFSRASQELEHALVIDPERDEVRKELAQILHHRAQLADAFHNAERREELLRRLALYDATGRSRRSGTSSRRSSSTSRRRPRRSPWRPSSGGHAAARATGTADRSESVDRAR